MTAFPPSRITERATSMAVLPPPRTATAPFKAGIIFLINFLEKRQPVFHACQVFTGDGQIRGSGKAAAYKDRIISALGFFQKSRVRDLPK